MTKTRIVQVPALTVETGTVVIGDLDVRLKAWRIAHVGGKVEITFSGGGSKTFAPDDMVWIERA